MSVFVGEPSSGNRGSEQKDMGLPHVAWLRKQVFKQHPAPGGCQAKPSLEGVILYGDRQEVILPPKKFLGEWMKMWGTRANFGSSSFLPENRSVDPHLLT